VFSNARHVLSQCNTWLRILYYILLIINVQTGMKYSGTSPYSQIVVMATLF